MKKVLAFPQLGDYKHPIKKLLQDLTHLEVIDTPPITKKTIALGSKNAPDSVCVPFKYNLGNFIEALELGANVLFQAGGGCRYRYYAEVQETILRDLGYDFTFIQIIGRDHLRFKELYHIFKNLNPKLTKRTFIKALLFAFFYITYLDKLDEIIRYRVGFEIEENTFLKLKKNFINECNKAKNVFSLTKIYYKYKKKSKKVKIQKPKNCLKIGFIGELYTAMEPFANYELEKKLAKYHIEIKRFTNLSYLLWKKALFLPFMKRKVKKYCKYTLGADGLDNVYRVLWLKKHGYDGIIHTKPTGCTPEIGALPIIMKVAKEEKMPILFFSFDEQSGIEGINTRLEAFYDLLTLKKEEEYESLFRN